MLQGVAFRRNFIEQEPVNVLKMINLERLSGRGGGRGKRANHIRPSMPQ